MSMLQPLVAIIDTLRIPIRAVVLEIVVQLQEGLQLLSRNFVFRSVPYDSTLLV